MSIGPKETSVDEIIARLAGRQRGYVSREQLLAAGVGPEAIKYRLKTGRLIQVYRGVYAVGHLSTDPIDRAAAAVLACGPDAVLSHLSALCLYGWRKPWTLPFDVTATSRHKREGIRVHESTALTPRDVRHHLGIRVTSPARTVLDCAPLLTEKGRRRVLREARFSHLLTDADLEDVLSRFPNHPGARLLARTPAAKAPTRSEFEDAFLPFCERFGLPRPEVNVHVAGHRVDALFEAEKVIVELDGYEFHGDRDSFETDRDRDADTLAAGYVTIRITWPRLIDTPQREADRLRAILARRRAQAAAIAAGRAASP